MNKIDNRFFREITYIYWRKEAEIILVNQEEFVNKFKELKESRQIIPYSTVRKKYRGNTFSFVKKNDYFQLFLKENKKYVTYSTTFQNTLGKRNELYDNHHPLRQSSQQIQR